MAEQVDHSAVAEHGGTVAGTEAHAGGEHGPEPTFLGLGAPAFVALAMIVVIGIILWKRVPAAIGTALDKKIALIRGQLDEAAKLRAEAEALRAEYEAKAAAADAERATMLERARHEAEGIVEQAKATSAALVERRQRMAEDKIAAAERAAVDEVRAKAVSAAAIAAEALIREQHDAAADKAMVDKTISELARRH
jgi:F-type H+-transporting ATPase subunit b